MNVSAFARSTVGVCALSVILASCDSPQTTTPVPNTSYDVTSTGARDVAGSAAASDIGPDSQHYKFTYIPAPEAQDYTLVLGSRHDFWYPSDFDSKSYNWTISQFSSSGHKTYDVPAPCKSCAVPDDLNVSYGPDHRVWFGQCCEPYFGAMDGAGRTQYYPAGLACNGTGCNIVVGAALQGNVWFSAVSGSRSFPNLNVGYINAKTGKVTKFSVATDQTPLAGEIVIGPDKNLWFADDSNIGRVTPKGVVTLFPTDPKYYTEAQEIIVGPDGDLWYSSPNSVLVGRMSTSGNVLSTFAIKNGTIRQLVLGADNHVWLSQAQALIRMTSPKTYQTYPIKQKGAVECQPHGFVIGDDGNLWFSETEYSTSGTCSLGLGTVIPRK
ncbi:MAG: hypothetical protein WA215_13620 [Candidatus Cybelea sp.]